MNRRFFWSVPLISYIMVIFLAACNASQPRVLVSSPNDGSEFGEGQIIPIQSVSTDSSGITRVEVFVDGFMLRTDTLPKPQREFSITQNWQATAGSHIISVRAFNTSGVASEPVTLRVSIAPALNPLLDSTVIPDSPTPLAAATPTMPPTVALTPTATAPLPTSTPAALAIRVGSGSSSHVSSGGSGSDPPDASSGPPAVATQAPAVRPQPPPPSPGGSPSHSSGTGGKGGDNGGKNGNGNSNANGHARGNGHGKGPKNK